MVDKKMIAGLGSVFIILLIAAILLLTGGNKNSMAKVNLYYINPTEFKLERRTVEVEGKANLENALGRLFAGIEDATVENLFPKDVKYISSKVDKENDILILNLSTNAIKVNYGYEVNYLYLMSIVMTVYDITGYEKVKLTFDGKTVPFFNNSIYLGDALNIDESVIK